MLIEIHMIQNHSPSNLNRDDLGAPKTCLFGGVTRARISSQCLKRSIRNPGNSEDIHNREPDRFAEKMKGYIGTRTKFFPELVREALKNSAIPESDHGKIAEACAKIAKNDDGKTQSSSEEEEKDERLKTDQLIFLGPTEARNIVAKLDEMRSSPQGQTKYKDWVSGKLKDKKLTAFLKEIATACAPRSADIALFGRMTTSDAFQDVEAAMQAAHALSTHAVVNEVDYFTAVDDLAKTTGAGHVAEAMFNSACFYKYFCLDWDQLVSNLTPRDADDAAKKDARRLAAATLGHFLRAAALTTPSGKKNSHAQHNDACGILVEIKKNGKTATNYANAFAEPVERIGKPADDAMDESSIEGRSVAALANHAHAIRKAYGFDSTLLWYSPSLWRFPLRYWERAEDGKKTTARPLTERRFDLLGGNGGPAGLVEAVIQEIGLDWREVEGAGRREA